jgi:hypothetical protein
MSFKALELLLLVIASAGLVDPAIHLIPAISLPCRATEADKVLVQRF